MRPEVRTKLQKDLNSFFGTHRDNLRSWFQESGQADGLRFWTMLRSDLMRLRPEEISGYLQDASLKLAEAGSFGPNMAENFFKTTIPAQELRDYQEALIYACLEMEAASRLNKAEVPDELKTMLREKLQLW